MTVRNPRHLSATQRAFVASQLRNPGSASMNMALVVEFDQEVDADRFTAAFDRVVQSSDVLRSQLLTGERTTVDISATPTSTTSLGTLSKADFEPWAAAKAQQPFNLSQCCYESVLISHPAPDGGSTSTSSWFINIHHVAIDATAFQMLIERTVAAYLGDDPAPSSFYAWVGELEEPDERRASFWADRKPAPRPGRVYHASDRTAGAAYRLPVALEGDQNEALANAIQGDFRLLSAELSWAAFLVTSTAIYLHRLTRSTEFAVGVPVHHRNTEASATVIGPTLGVYPVDILIEADDTYRSLHRRIARSLMTSLGNAHPALSAPGDYDAVVNVIPNVAPEDHPDLPSTTRWIHSGAIDPEHVLRVQATRYGRTDVSDEHLDIHLDLQKQVVDDDQLDRAGEHFAHVIVDMVADPDRSIYAAVLPTNVESAQIIGSETRPDLSAEPKLIATLLRKSLSHNDDVVLRSDDLSLTGRQLWEWTLRLATDLNNEPVEGRIGIEFGPSIEAVVAIYACVLANRPFVPLDPEQPEVRRAELARRAGITRTLRSVEEIAAFASPEADVPDVHDLPHPDLSDEAYLLFTSGSTGTPKGVPISHLGLSRYIEFAMASYFPRTGDSDGRQDTVAALFTALTFDLTITTLFAPILHGGQLVALATSGPAALTKLADHVEINWIKATPSHLEVLLPLLPPSHALTTIVVGGEAFRSDLAERLLGFNSDMAIFNEYGPTEAVVGCMIHRVDPSTNDEHAAVPIGIPAPGVELRVMDPGGARAPLGTAGELWIAHAGLTAGYLDDSPNDTPDNESPFVDLAGTRFYRSGDLVTRNSDLGLTYLGRVDEQIKVGGVRLDPSEVEAALMQHPSIAGAAVRQWTPTIDDATLQHCVRCGLPSNVPGVSYDDHGTCSSCLAYDQVAPIADSWFRTEADLVTELTALNASNQSTYDCIHLMSGGKDSTFALYKLVELGFRPYVLSLDNGFISEGAIDNVKTVSEHLGVDYEFVTTPQMNAIFRDSLATHSDVCHGCYKTIYTLATNRAVELGVPAIVTGLSRGQLFETRLIPGQFSDERFDPDAIDRAVVEARKRYHRAPDFPNRVLDTKVFETDEIFESLKYIDIYRYLDIDLSTVLSYLNDNTPWKRPADTGRSSNCLINIAGIHAHQIEQGYHNYAEPYAWDVRLGHKQREQSMAELDDPTDPDEIAALLSAVGYAPKPKQIFTAWFEVEAGMAQPTPTELRSFLADRLPAYAIPAAFVALDNGLPTTTNGKLDQAALPAPDRQHRAAIGAYLAPESELEAVIIEKWESMLGLNPISADDDFFALGGDSLAAVTMIIELGADLDLVIREELAFIHSTPRDLAAAIVTHGESRDGHVDAVPLVATRQVHEPPTLSAGEMSLLFHQRSRPGDAMYNIARTFTVAGSVDQAKLRSALEAAVVRHEPLQWAYGTPRTALALEDAIDFTVADAQRNSSDAADHLRAWQQRPYDLDAGPLLRCIVQSLTDGQTIVGLSIHHVSGDHQSLDLLWADIDRSYQGHVLSPLEVGYGDFCAWQRTADEQHQAFWDSHDGFPEPADFGKGGGQDDYLTAVAETTPAQLRTSTGRTPVANAVAAAAAAVAPFFAGGDVEVNLVSSTRDHDLACDLVGYLLNPLPLRFDSVSTQNIDQLAQSASQAIAPALTHRAYPFAQIVADARTRGVTPPTGRVLVSYADDPPAQLGGMPAEQHMLFNGHAVADASFFVEPRTDQVIIGLEYNGAALDASTAALLLERFGDALHAASTNADLPVTELHSPPLSIASGERLNDNTLVLDHMLRNAAANPDRRAIEVGAESLTWNQVIARASQVAEYLATLELGESNRVAVRFARSPELLVAIVGVHLAGASYVPIDASYPDDRIATTRELSGAVVELSADNLTSTGLNNEPWDDTTATATPTIGADDEAYVIFTSGSTGTPNGVPISHGQLANSTNARASFYEHPPSRFLMLSSVAFDSSIVGLFWPCATGATIVLPTEEAAHDIDALTGLFAAADLSHVLCVPTLYEALLERTDSTSRWPAHVIVAGEACTQTLVKRHFELARTTGLTNEYGPTEAAVWATAHHCKSDDPAPVPIGSPIAGTWACIVDETSTVLPDGMRGELVLGGPNVSAGYLATDSHRFGTAAALTGLPDEFIGPIFRTGDSCRMVDGQLYFLGRADDQLNIGGARVEPTEIEAALARIDGVTSAVVVGVDVRSLESLLAEVPGDQASEAMRRSAESADPAAALRAELLTYGRPDVRLVAHLIAPSDLDERVLREAVEFLPATHRPRRFEVHESLPLLPNGKIDRAAAAALPLSPVALPTIQASSGDAHLNTALSLFNQVLQVSDISPDDSFFDLGGDSLRALELLRTIESTTDLRLATSTIHNAPTPRALADVLAQQSGATTPGTIDPADNTIVMRIQPKGQATPIFALHNLGVDGSMWRPMAGYLGDDQPMYGIADPFALLDPFGDNYNLDHRPEIHETAQRYAEHIQAIAPTGPIVLLGFCLGGVFGYEVAQQLAAAGRKVENFIIVLDWHAPHLEYEENWVTLTKLSYRRSGKSLPAHIRGVLTRRAFLKSLNRRIEGYAVRAASKLRLPLTKRLRDRQYVEEGIHRIHSYEYLPYDGTITIVRSNEDPRIPTNLGNRGWGDLVDDLQVHYVPGVGEKMLYEPHIEAVSAVIAKALDQR